MIAVRMSGAERMERRGAHERLSCSSSSAGGRRDRLEPWPARCAAAREERLGSIPVKPQGSRRTKASALMNDEEGEEAVFNQVAGHPVQWLRECSHWANGIKRCFQGRSEARSITCLFGV